MTKRLSFLVVFSLVSVYLEVPSFAGDSNSSSGRRLTELMAIHSQGVAHELGRNVPVNYPAAARWYERGANLGFADSQNDLAKLYENGRGVPQDNVRAYYWYTLAIAGGNGNAVVNRNLLTKRMDVDQIAVAEQWVRAKVSEPE